jgi:hypothetical protein
LYTSEIPKYISVRAEIPASAKEITQDGIANFKFKQWKTNEKDDSDDIS